METLRANQTGAPVPLLDVCRSNGPLRDEILAAIARVVDSGRFLHGPEVAQLEHSVAQLCGVQHAVACASGSDALLLALMALDIGVGDEVIVPSFTFFATASAVWRLGARPVFVDIDPRTFNLDPQKVADAVTPRTRAIIAVHLFGQCADMAAIGEIAARRGLFVIEDAAQAIGARFLGRPAGSLSALGCFSFYPTKNLGGFGDGGMLTTHDAALAQRLRLLAAHGMSPRYYHQAVGINSRLDSIQAAVLNVKLTRLAEWTARRVENARRYEQLFCETGLAKVGSSEVGVQKDSTGFGVPDSESEVGQAREESAGLPVTLPFADLRCDHVWNQFTIRIAGGRRDIVKAQLAAAGIGSEIYYPVPLHLQKCFQTLGYRPGALPQTERAAREVLSLPIFPELTAQEQAAVVNRLAAILTKPLASAA